jgi:hypothetical protein
MKYLARIGAILKDQRHSEIVVEVDSEEDPERMRNFLYDQLNCQLQSALKKRHGR